MKVNRTKIKDCLVVEGDRHFDHRGFFQEIYNDEHAYDAALHERPGIPRLYWSAQTSFSNSKKNVLRGLHRAEYAKLVTCISGKVFDVVVDLRSNSPTFKEWVGVELSQDNSFQIYVPPGCGHGFLALEDNSSVLYMQSNVWRGKDVNIRYDDPDLNISWPKPRLDEFGLAHYILSEKDQKGLYLSEWLSV